MWRVGEVVSAERNCMQRRLIFSEQVNRVPCLINGKVTNGLVERNAGPSRPVSAIRTVVARIDFPAYFVKHEGN